jgi:hypothetical protein
LLVKHPPERKSPILPGIAGLLRERGATVDLFHPDESLTDPSRVRVEHDLYVLKSGSEAALSLAGALHQQGATILNPYPAAAALRDNIVSTRALQAAGVPVPDTWIARDPQELVPLLDAGALTSAPRRGARCATRRSRRPLPRSGLQSVVELVGSRRRFIRLARR